MRTLRFSCRGEDVRYLQRYLNNALPDLPALDVDGRFGRLTQEHVKTLQTRTGLIADGSVGPATRADWGLDDFHVHVFSPGAKLWIAGTPYGSDAYPLRTLKEWAKLEGVTFVWNLAFFNTSGTGRDKYGPIKGRTLTYVKAKGYDVGYGGTAERITLSPGNVCAGYKLAIKDGKACTVSRSGKRARNATGLLKDGRFVIVQTVTTATEKALVDYMLKHYDMDLLLIQDGGGSVGMYDAEDDVLIAGEREGKDGRPVATVICLKGV